MGANLLNIGLAFIEGLALIFSPCILPILPIILTGSLTGNKSRPYGIILGFVLTFTLVTLFSRAIVQATHVSPDTLRYVSYALLLLFGVIMLSSTLTEKFNLLTERLTRVGSSLQTANNTEAGWIGGLIFGSLIGIIWTPCSGPILAAVIVQSLLQQTTINSLFVVFAFSLGAGIPMLLIVIIGRSILSRFKFFNFRTGLIRKLLGWLIIFSVFILMYDTKISYAITKTVETKPATMLLNGLEKPYDAPQIGGVEAWINSPPLTISSLKGKVVLIDFWTYSCINCIRTLPYLVDWYAKYHHKGLEIIGIHSPEFEFERSITNVKNAVKKFGILYPVALDNNFVTWQNFNNQYWPAHYLIDQNGKVVYQHFGEGEYEVTENNIRFLLGLNEATPSPKNEQYYSSSQTPETYFGSSRAENSANVEKIVLGEVTQFHYPAVLAANQWALQGKWIVNGDKIISAAKGASLKLHFNAGVIYAVLGNSTSNKPISVDINVDSNIPALIDGHEGPHGKLAVAHHELYSLATLKQEAEGTIELVANSPGLEVYTFTFGG